MEFLLDPNIAYFVLMGAIVFVLIGWGIAGVALGTLVAMVAVRTLVYTPIALRRLEIPPGKYLRDVVWRGVVAGLVIAAACQAANCSAVRPGRCFGQGGGTSRRFDAGVESTTGTFRSPASRTISRTRASKAGASEPGL